jgi:hypothetical protein
MEVAEARRKVALGAWTQILIFEEQHVTFRERGAQACNNAVGQGLRQVDARYEAADCGR